MELYELSEPSVACEVNLNSRVKLAHPPDPTVTPLMNLHALHVVFKTKIAQMNCSVLHGNFVKHNFLRYTAN